MTKEEKNILLKDLCARLQYKPHCRVFKLNEDIKENDDVLYGVIGDNVITLKSDEDECLMYYQIKPYLRPMNSITKDEEKELGNYLSTEVFLSIDGLHSVLRAQRHTSNFLYSRHLDVLGLIEKGLAIEAPEGMYN
jgi:hypothetical protein